MADLQVCLLGIDHWSMCMTKAEWSGWVQAVGSMAAILVGFHGIRLQLKKQQALFDEQQADQKAMFEREQEEQKARFAEEIRQQREILDRQLQSSQRTAWRDELVSVQRLRDVLDQALGAVDHVMSWGSSARSLFEGAGKRENREQLKGVLDLMTAQDKSTLPAELQGAFVRSCQQLQRVEEAVLEAGRVFGGSTPAIEARMEVFRECRQKIAKERAGFVALADRLEELIAGVA